jgi:hypothetical protein
VPLPPGDASLDRVFWLLSGLAPVAGRARRLPSLGACHAKIVVSPIATDAISSKLVMCGPLSETGRAMVIA